MTTDIVMGEAFDLAVRELDQLIDRRFAARRTMTVERESEKHWVAELSGEVLCRHESPAFVLDWARTFAARTPGVVVECPALSAADAWADAMWVETHSVRVPALRVVQ